MLWITCKYAVLCKGLEYPEMLGWGCGVGVGGVLELIPIGY